MSLAVCMCLVGAIVGPASADKGPWPDQGDGRGALAIRKIEIGHIRSYEKASTVTVVFERPVDPADLKRRDFLVLEVAGNAQRKSDIQFFFWGGEKRWFTYSYDPQDKTVGYGGFWIRRVSPTTFKITLPYIESHFRRYSPGYHFRLASFSRSGQGCASGCWDAVPNGSWLIHDWGAPVVERWEVPKFSMPSGDQPGVPLTFRVTDAGFSRLAKWRISARLPDEPWKKAFEGRSTDRVKRLVPAEQGQKLQVRLKASDRAGNDVKPAFGRTVVPYDDSNTYGNPTFLGTWAQQERPGSYLGAFHVSSSPLDSFRFTATAKTYCVSYQVGDEFGYASFEVGGSSSGANMSHSYDGSTNDTHCVTLDTAMPRTAVLEVSEGVINVDGYWAE